VTYCVRCGGSISEEDEDVYGRICVKCLKSMTLDELWNFDEEESEPIKNDRAKMTPPLFWMHEESGRMKEIVMKFLEEKPLNENELKTFRAYLAQWVSDPVIYFPDKKLMVKTIETASQELLHDILDELLEHGIDPL